MPTIEMTPPTGVRREPFPRPWTTAEFEKMQSMGIFANRTVELIDGQILERADGQLRPFVFTRKEYYALDNFFIDQRVQLINGEIVQESPTNPPHAKSVYKATTALARVFTDGFLVRCQLPLDLGLATEPHPDVAVVEGSIDDFGDGHPTTAVLVVEVSDTSFDSDWKDKGSLYAAAGFADYWIVDLVRHRVLVCRNPKKYESEPHGHHYASLSAFDTDATISPLAVPDARIRVADLLP